MAPELPTLLEPANQNNAWCEEKVCELKIDASEGSGRTTEYATVETFRNVDLDPVAAVESRRQ